MLRRHGGTDGEPRRVHPRPMGRAARRACAICRRDRLPAAHPRRRQGGRHAVELGQAWRRQRPLWSRRWALRATCSTPWSARVTTPAMLILHDPDPFYRTLGPRCLLHGADRRPAPGRRTGPATGRRCRTGRFPARAEHGRATPVGRAVGTDAGSAPPRGACRWSAATRTSRGSVASGELFEAPGLLAHRYAALGGAVRLHGKPSPRIYDTCLRDLPYPAPAHCRCRRLTARTMWWVQPALAWPAYSSPAGCTGRNWESTLVKALIRRRCGQLYARTGATPDYLVPLFRLTLA